MILAIKMQPILGPLILNVFFGVSKRHFISYCPKLERQFKNQLLVFLMELMCKNRTQGGKKRKNGWLL
jgi:hypothetical protein